VRPMYSAQRPQLPRRLGLLVSTFLLVLGQPTAWAEGPTRKVGIVTSISLDAASRSPLLKQFTDAVRASVPDQNITFEFRSAEGKNERYPQIILDLVRQRANVIWVGPIPAAVAAQQLGVTVPVVFQIGVNPVTLGLIKGLERPGTHMTGLYEESVDYPSRRIGLLKELVPRAKALGILWDAQTWGEEVGIEMARENELAALAAGAQATIVPVRGPDDLQRAFSSLRQAQVDGILVAQSPAFFAQARLMAELASQAKIPTIYPTPNYAEAGGFASLGLDLEDAFRLEAGYIGRILKGTNPADMPVLRPERTVITVNAKAARELGIFIPPQIQARLID